MKQFFGECVGADVTDAVGMVDQNQFLSQKMICVGDDSLSVSVVEWIQSEWPMEQFLAPELELKKHSENILSVQNT